MYFVESSIGVPEISPSLSFITLSSKGIARIFHAITYRRHAKFSQEREYRELQSIQQT